MKLIMLATGPFAGPAFRRLYETRHDIAALVTTPVRVHRGKQVSPVSAIRNVAREHGTPVLDPESVNTTESQQRIAELDADLMVVCDYGQILSTETLAATRSGGLNLHGSLLPKYRGAAPINWAIYHGETETGVTVIQMTPKLDAGPCIARATTAIDPDETAVELERRLSELGAPLICDAIDAVESGRVEALPQDPTLVSKAPRLKKTDGAIDWTRPAVAIRNQVRAFQPWPQTYTFWLRTDGRPLRLILGRVEVVDEPDLRGDKPRGSPGEVLEAATGRLVIAAGSGAVMPQSVQPAGKRLMTVEEFLRGYRVRPGERFAPG